MSTKRAYKLQEFVAHASNVNCVKIGRKTSRILLTGGEDNKVNLWSIGKPNSILSLSGHTSPVESVNFDSSEVLVAAGAASGTIKLWDLEEAKVIRSLTGHRSNCVSIDFHPFGEFIASGSLDTNLKIWDIRRKSCIHTYKGHTKGVNVLRFTPDGKWVVSGGEDNSVKIWDLTAGKLLNDFKLHEGEVQCLDFHPNEFLLATGSADKTVKLWDLETFELIGSSGPEPTSNFPTSSVRSLTFNSDGRTLFCGLHESLKVVSWEPIRCHDMVEVGWSKLSDLNVHEGKLLGCSYNQSCVGIWVVDLSQVEPYAVRTVESKSNMGINTPIPSESNITANIGRLSISKTTATDLQTSTPRKASLVSKPIQNTNSSALPRRNLLKSQVAINTQNTKEDTDVAPVSLSRTRSNSKETCTVVPIVIPRTSTPRGNVTVDSSKEIGTNLLPINSSRSTQREDLESTDAKKENSGLVLPMIPKPIMGTGIRVGIRRKQIGDDSERENQNNSKIQSHFVERENNSIESSEIGIGHRRALSAVTAFEQPFQSSNMGFRGTRSPVIIWERNKHTPIHEGLRGRTLSAGRETESASDEDAIADIMEQHNEFVTLGQTRLTKLQVVHRLWQKNDMKGMLNAMQKMSDHAVSADIVSVLVEKIDTVTLDICTSLLSLVVNLLESRFDRHLSIALEMLLKLVKIFGPTIQSTVTGPPLVGVDLHAEERLERCNLCYIELEKLKSCLPAITRRGGSVGKSAQELNLVLQEI